MKNIRNVKWRLSADFENRFALGGESVKSVKLRDVFDWTDSISGSLGKQGQIIHVI
jgi:hypothetical protein